MLAIGNKGVTLSFSVCCESAPTYARAGSSARLLLEAHEVISQIRKAKIVKVYSQAGIGIFIREKPLVSLCARDKFNVLQSDYRTITKVCLSSMAGETRGLGLQGDSMQFFEDLLNEFLGESAPSSKHVHFKPNAI